MGPMCTTQICREKLEGILNYVTLAKTQLYNKLNQPYTLYEVAFSTIHRPLVFSHD